MEGTGRAQLSATAPAAPALRDQIWQAQHAVPAKAKPALVADAMFHSMTFPRGQRMASKVEGARQV